MPRYYFDIHEGKHEAIDEEGFDCAGIEAAQREAFHTLADIAKMEASDSGDWFSEVRVRDDAGRPVLITRLTLTAQRV